MRRTDWRIGIVTGLAFEAETLRAAASRAGLGDRVRVLSHGPGRAPARAAAAELAGSGVSLLISAGLAGGLAPDIGVGDVILAGAVLGAAGERLDCLGLPADIDAAGPRRGLLAEALAPVASPAAKRDLHAASGALGVDMESYGVGLGARAAGLPFFALRAVSDPFDQAIPAAALAGMRADGSVAIGPVLAGLARRPAALGELIALGRQSRIAREALGGFGERLLRRLVLMDV